MPALPTRRWSHPAAPFELPSGCDINWRASRLGHRGDLARVRGHDYVTLAADAVVRRVLSVTEGRDTKTIELAGHLLD